MHKGSAVSKAEDQLNSTERRAQMPPAAQRALAEAEARRRGLRVLRAPLDAARPRGGPDPARYGDWEVKGIASDF
jgi:hypothetical protein